MPRNRCAKAAASRPHRSWRTRQHGEESMGLSARCLCTPRTCSAFPTPARIRTLAQRTFLQALQRALADITTVPASLNPLAHHTHGPSAALSPPPPRRASPRRVSALLPPRRPVVVVCAHVVGRVPPGARCAATGVSDLVGRQVPRQREDRLRERRGTGRLCTRARSIVESGRERRCGGAQAHRVRLDRERRCALEQEQERARARERESERVRE